MSLVRDNFDHVVSKRRTRKYHTLVWDPLAAPDGGGVSALIACLAERSARIRDACHIPEICSEARRFSGKGRMLVGGNRPNPPANRRVSREGRPRFRPAPVWGVFIEIELGNHRFPRFERTGGNTEESLVPRRISLAKDRNSPFGNSEGLTRAGIRNNRFLPTDVRICLPQ